MRRSLILTLALAALAAAAPAQAVNVALHSSNMGITSLNVVITGNTIDIYEIWGAAGRGYLQFNGIQSNTIYTVRKHITNNTGADWNRFANELLDPGLDQADPLQPGWVPGGFSTSHDFDGLSFAQGIGLPRTSTAFSGLDVDELTDARDFIDFHSGTVSGSGGMDLVSFGLTDGGNNEPFLLAQRPNEASIPEVPEPVTLLLLGAGLMAGAAARRPRRGD